MTTRDDMLREVVADYRRTSGHTGLSEPDPRVLEAMAAIPRDRFVSAGQRAVAWENQALSIPCGQTISQPYVVALMTDVLRVGEGSRVLEIGSGSGYQTAVLLAMGATVFAVEMHAHLVEQATARLDALGYRGFSMRVGDGYLGWDEHAPFDRILVAAAAPEVPRALLDQLAPGGRMILPLEAGHAGQELTLITKSANGVVERRSVLPVRFVPLVRGS